jgi:Ser/Thr protein kinase RdoA (MazF antagonist)
MAAPRLYDIGTVAAVNADDPSRVRGILGGYLAVAPELDQQLPFLDTFTRLRWMSVAVYMADRIARGILRGGSAEENNRTLRRACAGMRCRPTS